MNVRPLGTTADYDAALAEIEPYFSNPPPVDTTEATRFDVLAALIEAYEVHHWPIDPPDLADRETHQ
jgi:HTH-type transcriptional regulator/antitoxin HigA